VRKHRVIIGLGGFLKALFVLVEVDTPVVVDAETLQSHDGEQGIIDAA
jgi:hypothetical protein